MLDLWYKNAVVYCVDVETFMDSDGDGVGDFRGLTDRLDHLETLGVTCIWLLPFYPSPRRDNGYDVADFYGIDPRLGTPGDFVAFTHAAHDRGIRVIVDLVVNHTSRDHPWFQSARSSPDSPYRDWYVWSKEEPEDRHEGVIFHGVEEAIWSYDEKAEAWYLHRFYGHQADLNVANPAVREEVDRIMGYWLQLGVDGFRLDAAPFLLETIADGEEAEGGGHHYLNHLRRFVSWRRSQAMIMAEADVEIEEAARFFGRGDRMHVVLNFPLNQGLFLALARRSAEPLRQVMADMSAVPDIAQWGTFLRNHDELNLAKLSEAERAEVFAAFAPDPGMRVYGHGVRRRLAGMFEGDLDRLKLAYSLLFALPGTPILWYGEEIGMGEDLSLSEREAVRTPMHWSGERNGGFSTAPRDRLVRPVIEDGPFGHDRVNVASQREAPETLMAHVQQLIRIRRGCPEIGRGQWRVLDAGADGVLALCCTWQDGAVVTLHNLADRPVEVSLDLAEIADRMLPLLEPGHAREPQPVDAPVPLSAYGFAWFRLHGERR